MSINKKLFERAITTNDLDKDEWDELGRSMKGNWNFDNEDHQLVHKRMCEFESKRQSSMNIYKLIEDTYNRHQALQDEKIHTIAMGEDTFARWYYYCQDHNLDYMEWEHCSIVLAHEFDKDALVPANYNF